VKIHEYQAKQIFARHGVPIPRGIVCTSAAEAQTAAATLIEASGVPVVVVKAQIHAGGRGKGGGVLLVRDGPVGAGAAASRLLGKKLVTHQTGPDGQTVRAVYVEEGLEIAREIYLGLVVDRQSRRIAVMASTEGGVEIEKVAKEHPERILTESIDPSTGLLAYQTRNLAFALGLGAARAKFGQLVGDLARLFEREDCQICEINPLVLTSKGDLVALDAKIVFDDNAAFRHEQWHSLRDPAEEDPTELEAKQAGLSYVSLDGNIGCLVNGAGLAMATMDIIKHHGGQPANFLDVGGGASRDQVAKAFTMIVRSPRVRAIFVNIFGGIMRCDVLAEGIVAATRDLGLAIPLVVRMAGTSVERGRAILAQSGLPIRSAESMAEGAKLSVLAANNGV
jgi:succinyl-CoA synthetase beta subunit